MGNPLTGKMAMNRSRRGEIVWWRAEFVMFITKRDTLQNRKSAEGNKKQDRRDGYDARRRLETRRVEDDVCEEQDPREDDIVQKLHEVLNKGQG